MAKQLRKWVCRHCGRAPHSMGDWLGWRILPGPAVGGKKWYKGGPFVCPDCHKEGK